MPDEKGEPESRPGLSGMDLAFHWRIGVSRMPFISGTPNPTTASSQ